MNWAMIVTLVHLSWLELSQLAAKLLYCKKNNLYLYFIEIYFAMSWSNKLSNLFREVWLIIISVIIKLVFLLFNSPNEIDLH